jgi:hypothetical protein
MFSGRRGNPPSPNSDEAPCHLRCHAMEARGIEPLTS